jgi:hypothetical protein
VVGLLPCVVVVVGGAVVVVVLVGAVVGTTVSVGRPGVAGGTIVGETPGVTGPVVGAVVAGAVVAPAVPVVDDGESVADVLLDPSPGFVLPPAGVGRGVWTAASTGSVGRCFGLAASGRGISGVSMRGPPARLLAMSAR